MKLMKRKIEVSSLLWGAFTGAVAVLCVAAATTKTNAGASGDTTSKGKELEQGTGIGGGFFKVKYPKGMAVWYRTNLGIQSKGGYTDFTWRAKDHPEETGHTAWRIFPTNTTYFGQS